MKTLLIDNYDSFTYNLFQLLAEVAGVEPLVLRNDEEGRFRELPPGSFDAVVISPGPGHPEVARDFGLSRRMLSLRDKPLLGVCLGHQGLCAAHGGRVRHAPEPFHGRASAILHQGHPLFRDIPSPFEAIRYHSLVATELGPDLLPIASTRDGLVMAVAHRELPHYGVQFHPESIGTPHGRQLLENFRRLSGVPRAAAPVPASVRTAAAPSPFGLLAERVPRVGDPAKVVATCFAHEPQLVWLDSSAVLDGRSRHSIVGWPSEQHGEIVSYDVHLREVSVERVGDGSVQKHCETLFDHLKRQLRQRRVEAPPLPFDFALGYLGYLGYELKADCGAALVHRSPFADAKLCFCDRGVVFDHVTGEATLLALCDDRTAPAARSWLTTARAALERTFDLAPPSASPGASFPSSPPPASLPGRALDQDQATYLRNIGRCLEAIRDGESYEVCLTNRVTLPFDGDPFAFYLGLRRQNPAPFAAFLRFRELCVASASPERFLRVDGSGHAESRPIKGTARRSPEPALDQEAKERLENSEKERAENLMIIDLVRNDLGRVSVVGSVEVPRRFEVESYATVHQLVSTVRSRLRPDVDAVDCVRACFPGGSMTGAPKLRTMELLDELESSARGVYSGVLGYFSLNGAADLSIVIRTVVLAGGRATLGTGGAIVALSNPEREFEEAELKLEALLAALGTPLR